VVEHRSRSGGGHLLVALEERFALDPRAVESLLHEVVPQLLECAGMPHGHRRLLSDP
jgi:hypothetical protein